jgi:ABC-2 type transport system ATP-binding protein
MDTEITIANLSKRYGKTIALDGVSLHIKSGLYGLLGQNGAGKTTLMRILATLLPKSEGSVSVGGFDISQAKDIRRIIGYLPQEFSFYPSLRVREALDYLGLLSGMSNDERKTRIPDVLRCVNLYEDRNKRVKALSGGMKRRLGIAQAILHDPRILIVGEPTAGLDPVERIHFREMLAALAEGRTVIFSTHIIEDIEKTCGRLAVLNRGALVFNGELADFIGSEDSMEAAYIRAIGEA